MTHSDQMQNPTGGVWGRRAAMQPALRDDLIERVLDPANVHRAWKQVKANGGAAGVDGMTIAAFPAFARAQSAKPSKMAPTSRSLAQLF